MFSTPKVRGAVLGSPTARWGQVHPSLAFSACTLLRVGKAASAAAAEHISFPGGAAPAERAIIQSSWKSVKHDEAEQRVSKVALLH